METGANIYYPISALFNGVASLCLSIYVLIQDRHRLINKTFSCYAFAMAFWSFSYFAWQISGSAQGALFWSRMLMLGAIFVPPTFFHFVAALLHLEKKKKYEIMAAYCISIIFALGSFSPLFVKAVKPQMEFSFWPVPGPLFHFFLVLFFGCILYTFYLALLRYPHLSGVVRNRVKYVLLGTFISLFAGSTNYFLWYDIPIPPYGNALASMYVFTAAYAIAKYQLLDIRIAITRGAIFTLVYCIVFALPVVMAVYMEAYFERILGTQWRIGIFVAGGFFGYLAQLTYTYIRYKAEERFLREQKLFHAYIKEASNNILQIRNREELQNSVVFILTDAIKISHTLFYIFNKEQDVYVLSAFRGSKEIAETEKRIEAGHPLVRLLYRKKEGLLSDTYIDIDFENTVDKREIGILFDELEGVLIVPNFYREVLLGFIVMGKKLNNEIYSINDINILTTLANQVAMAMENASLYENLESMVQERTIELQKARDALWGEMQLAKKIQTVLLPSSPFVNGYEVFGYMDPADEVGGDYYDVINGESVDWVLIGDVSGHGIPAGLVMMMVQSSIQVLLRENPGIKPSVMLKTINRGIAYNVDKIDEDQYMTISALALYKDGNVFFSGLHQDLLVFRAKDSSVESIRTNGEWLGILDDLGREKVDFDFLMSPGDVLLLYTDGITEAMDKNNLMFGKDQLAAVLGKYGREPLPRIKQEIMDGLEEYTIMDDVTMVILRRK
ncbi:MAG: SpoIIE family protein phosphatase [bacterium]|nr:SpoIIE family protein phosphatase [bacterium]